MPAWMIYGASGYTGKLLAALASARGHAPILAGRSEEKLRGLASKLKLPLRAFPLDQPDLDSVQLVVHCAGPFSATSRPMADACLARGVHYLDITGEVQVFEALLARDAEAKARGVVLLPGVGFDVVPTDCLAALLHRALPDATSLELAFAPFGGSSSQGTLKTAIEALPRGGLVRRGGKLVPVPPAHEVRRIRFADKARLAMSIPWGDLSTAYRSTGIPDITVFMATNKLAAAAAKATRFAAPLLASAPVQRLLKRQIERSIAGPTEEERRRGGVQLWGRASNGTSARELRMTTPEGYTLTAEAALESALRVLANAVQPGAWTPSLAFGADFAGSLPGVRILPE